MAYEVGDNTPKPGQAAPLEGALGPQVAAGLNLLFGVMKMDMCLGLTRSITPGLGGPLLSKADLSGLSLNSPTLAAARNMFANNMSPMQLKAPSIGAPK